MKNLLKSKDLRIIFLYLAGITFLGLVPMIWSNKLTFDLVKITEEWYKVIINLILLLIGFFFFDYLIEKNERRKKEQEQKNISNNLNKYRTSIIKLFSGDLDKYEGQINLMYFLYTLELIDLNLDKLISDITILAYKACYNANIRNAIQILIEELKNNESLRNDAIEILKSYFNEVDEFLRLTLYKRNAELSAKYE